MNIFVSLCPDVAGMFPAGAAVPSNEAGGEATRRRPEAAGVATLCLSQCVPCMVVTLSTHAFWRCLPAVLSTPPHSFTPADLHHSGCKMRTESATVLLQDGPSGSVQQTIQQLDHLAVSHGSAIGT